MENTTKMQIEHIVIGMQTSLIILFGFISLEPGLKSFFLEMSSVIVFIIVIPIAYALGILVDRICDYLLFSEKKEKKIKRKICIEILPKKIREKENCQNREKCGDCKYNKISKQVWKKYEEVEYYNDAMTRKRILRATFLNCALGIVMIMGLWVGGKWCFSKQFRYVLLAILFSIALCCYFTYWKFVNEYYQKQRRYLLKPILYKSKGKG